MLSPYRSYMEKFAAESAEGLSRHKFRETAIDVGMSMVASRGLGAASVLGTALSNTADYAAARFLLDKAVSHGGAKPTQTASL